MAECVARGEADIGITLIPEIVPIKGARVIGKLPAARAGGRVYTAAVSAQSNVAAEASGFHWRSGAARHARYLASRRIRMRRAARKGGPSIVEPWSG